WFYDSPAEEFYRLTLPKLFKRTITLSEFVDRLADLPLISHPGTQWRYSTSVEVVGRLIEVISRMPLADFLTQRIFKPLGMVDTAFDVPPEKSNRLAQIYSSGNLYGPVAVKPDEVPAIGDVTKPTSAPLGGAGLISTLTDYLSFCNCLINNG